VVCCLLSPQSKYFSREEISFSPCIILKKLKEYKEKQRNILIQIEEHNKADENFYITASQVLDLSNRALEIFESSEVKEKRALVNLLLQNSLLSERKLLFSLRSPFYMIAKCGKIKDWGAKTILSPLAFC